MTNNSTKSRRAYAAKFTTLSIPVTPDEIFGSAYSAAVYIARILPSHRGPATPTHPVLPSPTQTKVFVLGMAGIEEELAAEGVPFCGGLDPALNAPWDASADTARLADGSALDPAVGIVLAGLDFAVSYRKLATALAYLQRGAVFLATNTDSTLPAAGALFPGAGSVGAPLVKAIGREALALGKPSQSMLDAIEAKLGTAMDRGRTCMVGDRLNTDIQFGIDGGLGGTLHVLTGVSSKADWGEPCTPAYYADKLGDLMAAATEAEKSQQKDS